MPERRALFLARRSYRRRRLTDASRALPALGAFLFLLPAIASEGGIGGSSALVFLLLAWGALIALAGVMAPVLAEPSQGAPEEGAPHGDSPPGGAPADPPASEGRGP